MKNVRAQGMDLWQTEKITGGGEAGLNAPDDFISNIGGRRAARRCRIHQAGGQSGQLVRGDQQPEQFQQEISAAQIAGGCHMQSIDSNRSARPGARKPATYRTEQAQPHASVYWLHALSCDQRRGATFVAQTTAAGGVGKAPHMIIMRVQ